MGRREKTENNEKCAEDNLIASLPPAHRIFFAVFRQAERDIEDCVKFINSGHLAKVFKEKGWTREMLNNYTNLKESLYFFSDQSGHFKDLADCANVDISNWQYKERIKMNLEVGRIAQEKLHQLNQSRKKAGETLSPDPQVKRSCPNVSAPGEFAPGVGLIC